MYAEGEGRIGRSQIGSHARSCCVFPMVPLLGGHWCRTTCTQHCQLGGHQSFRVQSIIGVPSHGTVVTVLGPQPLGAGRCWPPAFPPHPRSQPGIPPDLRCSRHTVGVWVRTNSPPRRTPPPRPPQTSKSFLSASGEMPGGSRSRDETLTLRWKPIAAYALEIAPHLPRACGGVERLGTGCADRS